MDKHSIGIAIPTYQAEKHLIHILPTLLRCSLKPKILIIDSSSTDGTMTFAKQYGVQTVIIPKNEFNHGLTREKARKILNTEIVVFLTQDAYPAQDNLIELLTVPLIQNKASVSYSRQVSHHPSYIFETFAREFNYPPESQLRSLKDAAKYGIYTFFCSNSCAAYKNHALEEIGGFKNVLFGEDTYAVAELLHKGHKIAYVAEAVVKHSHNYTIKQEFQRHFDMGISRKRFSHYLSAAGKDEKRGKDYATKLLKKIALEKSFLLPYAFFHLFAKWLGYKIGMHAEKVPLWLKKALSSQKSYWK